MNNHVTKPYYKPISIEKQACKLEDPICLQSSAEIVANLKDNYPPSRLRVLEVIMGLGYACRFIFPTLDYIAKKAGVSKRTVTNCLQDLEEAGYVSSGQRWNASSLYKYSDALTSGEVLQGLWQVSKIFSALFLAFVCSVPPTIATPPVPKSQDSQVRTDSCHLRNNLFINNPTETVLYDNIKNTSKLNTTKSQSVRRPMADHGGISQAIRDIKCLSLTKGGQIKLSAFPDGAIIYAVEQYKKSKNKPKDGFAWFFSVCTRWCQINNVEPNWKYLEELKERHRMPDGARMTFDTPDEQPFPAKGFGTGTVVKKTTGGKEKEVPATRQPYVIPARTEKTRDELIYDARNFLYPQRGPGSDMTTPAMKQLGELLAKDHPDIVAEAHRLGPLRTQSPEDAQARIDARFAKAGIRKIDYRQTAPQKPSPPKYPDITTSDASITNLTQVESYSRVDDEHGDEEF